MTAIFAGGLPGIDKSSRAYEIRPGFIRLATIVTIFGGSLMRRYFSLLSIVLIAIAVLTACNSAEKKTPSAGPVTPQTPSKAAPTDGIRRITVSELKELLASNEAYVVDVRNVESYNQSHIQGAKLIPVADTLKHIDQLPKDKLIVTYCS